MGAGAAGKGRLSAERLNDQVSDDMVPRDPRLPRDVHLEEPPDPFDARERREVDRVDGRRDTLVQQDFVVLLTEGLPWSSERWCLER